MNTKLTKLLAVPTLIAFVMTATAVGFRPTLHPPSIGGDSGGPIRNDALNGLNTTAFDTLVGTVTVNLPDDIAAGDTISGTVISEPKGKTSDEQAKNQNELNGYVVEVSEQPAPSQKSGSSQIDFCKDPAKAQDDRSSSVCKKWSIPDGVSMVPVVLKNGEGKIVSRAEVPVAPSSKRVVPNPLEVNAAKSVDFGTSPVGPKVNPAQASNYLMPPFGQTGKPLSVKGPFDGDFASTKVKLGNRPAKFLAASPRKVVVESPRDLNGLADIEIEYKGKTVAKCVYRSISVKLAADKLSLIKGEQTTLSVNLAGLIGLLSPVSLQLTNNSPGTVSMGGGERQTIVVSPGDLNGDTFTAKRTLTGVQAGTFFIKASFEPSESSPRDPAVWKTCPGTAGAPTDGSLLSGNLNGSPDKAGDAQKIFGGPPPKFDSNGEPIRNDGPSSPVPPLHATFRVTLNGFTVNHQTNQGPWASSDTVYFLPMASMVEASPEPRFFYGMGTPHESNGFDAGPSFPSRSGLRTGDGFPTQTTPWRRTSPQGVSLTQPPPNMYFEGEITQNTNALLIIPTIWVHIGNYDLGNNPDDPVHAYPSQINHDLPALGRAVARMIHGPQPLALASYLRPGTSMGLNNGMRLAFGVPRDRPIGMQPERDQFGFVPQVLVLTYDSAEFMSHTDFGFGIGVVPIRYVDPQSFAGDYTLYFQVERVAN